MLNRNLSVNIAGLNVLLETDTQEGFLLLERWLREYKNDTEPDFTIRFFKEENRFKFGFEEEVADDSDRIIQLRVGMGHIDFERKYAEGPDAAAVNRELARFLFTNFLRITVQYLLPGYGGILIHASAVVDKNKGYVFVAPNDGGKTTVAQKTGKVILSDDCVGLNRLNRKWHTWATPWGDINNYGRYPVAGIFFLVKSRRLKCSSLDKLSAIKRLFSNVSLSFPTSPQREPDIFENILSILETVCNEVPVYSLKFRKDDNIFDEIVKGL